MKSLSMNNQPYAVIKMSFITTVGVVLMGLGVGSLAQLAAPLGDKPPAHVDAKPTPDEAQAVREQQHQQQVAEEAAIGEDIFGTATITESKRDSGQVYEVEIKHSLGGKQYIEETDSDGSLETNPNDLEAEPNLPKWKLGSW